MSISLWIITKDIRLEDNYVLFEACKNSLIVYPVFIFDSEQFKNGGSNSIHFLIESIVELNDKLKLQNSCVHIVDKNSLDWFVNLTKVNNAYILSGFTPFEKNRNLNYKSLLNFTEIDDTLGAPRHLFLKSDGEPYRVFSAFEQNILNKGGLPTANMTSFTFNLGKVNNFDTFDFNSLKLKCNPKLSESTWKGGSNEGIRIAFNKYQNLQFQDISPHIKFGTVSPRLLYHCNSDSQRGILWRALYYSLFDKNIVYIKQRNIIWGNDPVKFQHWCNGTTGFDLIDAGINQLLRSGIMDNKIRMIVANFLVFVLNINWKFGEEFFRKYLVDYDWPLNIGNWAWCAQVGLDHPRPNKNHDGKAIRIFNPTTYLTDTASRRQYRNNYISRWLPRFQNSLQMIVNYDSEISNSLQYY